MKILVELRPALAGHAGIPQEARLLFRGLGQLAGAEVQGLIQSSDRFLALGLPASTDVARQALSPSEQIDRLSRVVVSLQPSVVGHRVAARAFDRLLRLAALAALVLRSVLGLSQKLSWFNPTHFRDFIWRSLFSKSLPVSDFEQVTHAVFRIAQAPYGGMHACGLLTRKLGHAVYPRLDTRGIDVMLALTPYPATVSNGTKLVVRYFDAVPLLMPHTTIHMARHQALHYEALRCNVASGAYFACCSDATRRDLLAVFPEVKARAVTIPCMLSHHYFTEESSARRVPEILTKRRNSAVYTAPARTASLPGAATGTAHSASLYLVPSTTLWRRRIRVNSWTALRTSRSQLP